ncbi:TPA: hypothetical protein RJD49_002749 [Legionella pneumophila]|nr:hypothetical protein [Legionella pneumophila]HDV5806928.1 hypothetical protein [Legionella pneumophila]
MIRYVLPDYSFPAIRGALYDEIMHHIPTNGPGGINIDFTPSSPQQSSEKSITILPKLMGKESRSK